MGDSEKPKPQVVKLFEQGAELMGLESEHPLMRRLEALP
jgi:hypothetical protein